MSIPLTKSVIEKLSPSHHIRDFDCGKQELNLFLLKYALQSQQSNSSQTYVAIQDKIIGYYSLSVGAAEHHKAPTRVTKGMAKYPIPLMILTRRLAVDKGKQGKGIGKGLLKDALLRTLQAADIAGIRALIVHAKDQNAKHWYQQFDFEPSPTDPLHLYLLMKDIKKGLQ